MVLLIVVDAMSCTYINGEEMPFLDSLTKNNTYIKKIVASPGYCERTEIFTGMYPDVSGNFTAIGYCPNQSCYRNATLLEVFGILEKISKKYTRKLFNIYSKFTKKAMLGYRIPFHLLDKFSLTEDKKSHNENDAFCGESIFSLLDEGAKQYTFEVFTALGTGKALTDSERVFRVKQLMEQNYDFIPMYIGLLDTMGHKYANKRKELRKYLIMVDGWLKEIYERRNELAHKNIDIVILGDHGMEPVTQCVDFVSCMESLKKKFSISIMYFLDSTIARIWCEDIKDVPLIRSYVENKLGSYGAFISEDKGEEYHIPFGNDQTYGDLIWCANKGCLIYPDFFNGTRDAGMHGYMETSDAGKGTLIIANGEFMKAEEGRLVDVCATVCELLGLRYPNKCQGHSLLK